MNVRNLLSQSQPLNRADLVLAFSGPSGPSAEDQIAVQEAARKKAAAEAEAVRVQQEREKAKAEAELLAANASQASADAARRQKTKLLLAGAEEEEGITGPTASNAEKKAKRSTLLGG